MNCSSRNSIGTILMNHRNISEEQETNQLINQVNREGRYREVLRNACLKPEYDLGQFLYKSFKLQEAILPPSLRNLQSRRC